VVFHAIEGRWIKIGEVQVEFDIRGGRKGEGERRGDLPAAETERGGNDMQAILARIGGREKENSYRGREEEKEKE
jgi:hypothetical protein